MIGIYKITCKISGKFYIGQSKDIVWRWNIHKKKLRLNKHTKKMQACYNKHQAFIYEVLEVCTIEELDEREQYYIDKLWCSQILNTDKDVITKEGRAVRATKSYREKYGPVKPKPRRITKPPIEYSEFDRKVYK